MTYDESLKHTGWECKCRVIILGLPDTTRSAGGEFMRSDRVRMLAYSSEILGCRGRKNTWE